MMLFYSEWGVGFSGKSALAPFTISLIRNAWLFIRRLAMSKVCTKCEEKKLISDFYKHRHSPDGHAYQCKECNKKRGKEYTLQHARNPHLIYRQIKAVNKSKNRKEVHCTEEDFVKWYDSQPKICAYCDIPEEHIMLLPEHFKMNRTRLAIDCKVNDLEYRLDNIVLSCGRCNSMKGDIFDYDTFREIAQKYLKPLWLKLKEEKDDEG